MEHNENFTVTFIVACRNEEDAARAVEAFSRPMAGLVLDGINIFIARQDPDE
jgi:hypothetical protein